MEVEISDWVVGVRVVRKRVRIVVIVRRREEEFDILGD